MSIQDSVPGLNQRTISIRIDELPPGADPQYINSVREALSEWEKANPQITFRETPENPDISVLWVREFGGKLGHVVSGDTVELGLGDSRCLGRYREFTVEAVRTIALHEFGHVVGLGHSDYESSIMYFQVNSQSLKYKADIEIAETLPDNWLIYYPVCSRSEVSTYSFIVNSNNPVDIYIVPSIEDYGLRLDHKTFLQYTDCKEVNVKVYTRTCTLRTTGGIIIDNSQGDGKEVSFTLKIIEN